MKMKKVLCLFMVFALTFAVPMAAPVEAAKKTTAKKSKKSKKLALNKTKKTLTVGKSLQLKLKNATKKQKKQVKWSTSKKKVATVSKKGKVKAKKAGTATITAKVGKKKLKCKITVKAKAVAKTTISSVTVLNSRTIQVGLSAAQALSASNFTVKSKAYDRGSYNRTLKIEKVSTSDKRTYRLLLDTDTTVSENQYVQVTVTGLKGSGTLSKTAVYSKGVFNYTYDSYIYRYMVNDTVNRDFDADGRGYCTYSVSGLPAGISSKLSTSGTYLRFTGKPTQAGIFRGKVVAKDELGDTYTYNITWLIGSENTIAAAVAPIYGVANTDNKYYVDQAVYAVGGSGSYDYAIQGANTGLEMSGSYLEGYLEAGTHNVSVQVTDRNNSSLKTTAVLAASIQAGRTISGVIKDAKGNPLPDAYVYFENKNRANRYMTYASTYTDNKGAYSIRLVDGTYDAYASGYHASGEIITTTINTTKSGVDFTIPVYPITVTTNNANVPATNFGSWYDDDDNYYGYGNKLYLKAGTYTLTSTYSTAMTEFEGRINVTVNAGTTTVTATVTSSSQLSGTIVEEQPLSVTMTGSYKYYSFTPKTTGTYYFYSERISGGDPYGRLYDASGSSLASGDDEMGNMDFLISYRCTAGTTYYIGIEDGNGDDGNTAILHVSATDPRDYEDEDEDW